MKLSVFVFCTVFSLTNCTLFSQEKTDWEQLCRKADSLRRAGLFQASIPLYLEAFEQKALHNDSTEYSRYEIRLGLSYFLNSQNEKAIALFENVVDRFEDENIFKAHGLNNLGLVYDNLGDFEKSATFYKEAAEDYLILNDQNSYLTTRMNEGIILKKQGKYRIALPKLVTAAKGFEKQKDSLRLGQVYSSMAGIQMELGELQKADSFYQISKNIREEIADSQGLASTLNNYGVLLNEQNNFSEAKKYLRKAIALMKENSSRNLGMAFHNLGESYEKENRLDSSLHFFKLALNEKIKIQDSAEIAITANKHAEVVLSKEPKKALEYLKLAERCLGRYPNEKEEKKNYEVQKNYYQSINRKDSALYYFQLAYDLQKHMNEKTYLQEVAILQEEFEVGRKNKTIDKLTKTNQKNTIQLVKTSEELETANTRFLTLLAFSILISLTSLFVWLYLKNKNRYERLLAKNEGADLEKKRISMELHDAGGSQLKEIKWHIEALQKEHSEIEISPIQEKIDEVSKVVRDLSHDLFQPNFDELTFSEFLNDYAFDWANKSDLKILSNVDSTSSIDLLKTEVHSTLYRILQEVRRNIEKHSQASKVEIRIFDRDKNTALEILDNGIGLQEKENKGIGMKNIEERCHLISAKLKFNSRPDKGTCIRIEIPTKKNMK